MSNTLLIHEPVIALQPTLVKRLGSITAAAVLQQLHYRCQKGDVWEDEDGQIWHPVTYTDLANDVGIAPEQVRRAIEKLEESGVIESCQIEKTNRRKSYRINIDHELLLANSLFQAAKLPLLETADLPDVPITRSKKTNAPTGAIDKEELKAKRKGLWDALVLAFGMDERMTKAARSKLGAAVKELLEVGAEPDQIAPALASLRKELPPNAAIHEMTLVSWWPRLNKGKKTQKVGVCSGGGKCEGSGSIPRKNPNTLIREYFPCPDCRPREQAI